MTLRKALQDKAALTFIRYRESFDDIHLDLSKQPGKCRFADSGLGWKPSSDGHTFTLDRDNILQGHWSRAARGYEVKVYTRSSGVIQLDGFHEEDYERLAKVFKNWYGSSLENNNVHLRPVGGASIGSAIGYILRSTPKLNNARRSS